MGLASVLIAEVVAPFVPSWSVALLGALGAVATYGTLAEIGINLARRRADDFTLRFLPFIGLLELVVLPLAAPVAVLGRWAARLVAAEPPPDARLTETEVEWVVAEGQKHGSLGREPAEMIRNVLELKDLVVRDVMVPRTRVSAIEVSRPIPEVLKIVASEGHSRFPVYRDKVDNIVGLLYAKDLFRILKDVRLQSRPLIDLVRAPVNFVPETQGVSSVLREMRSRRLHMAVVIDEFGGVSGIVTLEDILEVIVREIRDEYDCSSMRQSPSAICRLTSGPRSRKTTTTNRWAACSFIAPAKFPISAPRSKRSTFASSSERPTKNGSSRWKSCDRAGFPRSLHPSSATVSR
jgi:CBS domain containing-hemolysin-like protein